MADAPPLKVTIPNAPATGRQPPAYVKFVNKWSGQYPGLKNWSPQILQYAKENHMDPVYFASVLLAESGASQTDASGKIKKSSDGALGLGQLMPSTFVGQHPWWDPNHVTTINDLEDPAYNLRLSAQYLAIGVHNYGYQNAYTSQYNPSDPNRFKANTAILGRIPPKYLPGISTPGVSGAPGAGIDTGLSANPVKDPWVVVTSKGGLKMVNSVTAPKNVLTDGAGNAITQSSYTRVANGLDSIYMAYTGQRANAKAVAAYIKNPTSDYQIQQRLSNPQFNPRFYKSPVWVTHAPSYESVYKGIYGNDASPASKQAKAAITFGVVHNLDQTAFQQYLRDQPNYSGSQEYKGAAAQFQAGYSQIYGEPDQLGKAHIDLAVRKGWNGDQWMQYLRSQPEYTASGEFQKNVYDLFNRLGFNNKQPGVTPQPPTASFGPVAPTPAPNPAATGSALVG